MNKLVTNLGQRVSSSPAVAASVPTAVTVTTEANMAGVTRNSHSFSVKDAGERLLSHRTTARLDDEDRGHNRVPTDIACKSTEESTTRLLKPRVCHRYLTVTLHRTPSVAPFIRSL